MVCGALGVAFVFDDSAARTTPTVPTSRLFRHAIRVAIVLPAAGLWWAAALAVVALETEAPLPLTGLTVEAMACCCAAALAAGAPRAAQEGVGGVFAVPAVLALLAAASFLPERVALFVPPGVAGWAAAHDRWTALLVAAAIGAGWASRGR